LLGRQVKEAESLVLPLSLKKCPEYWLIKCLNGGLEEVFSAGCGYKVADGDEIHGASWGGKVKGAFGCLGNDRALTVDRCSNANRIFILFAGGAREIGIVDPLFLHKFKLSFDICLIG
jgi:hypothetical protein